MRTVRGTLWFDGASRGNPGPAGAGAVLEREDGLRVPVAKPLPFRATSNVAEYMGLIEGLRAAKEAGITHLDVVGDSELVVRQMTGRYAVEKPHLRYLHGLAVAEAKGLRVTAWRNVPRDQNTLADEQSNLAADEAQRLPLTAYDAWLASLPIPGQRTL